MKHALLVILVVTTAIPLGFGQPAGSKTSQPYIHEGYLTGADGVRLFYRKVGTGKNPIVLLHGGPGSNMNAVWPDLAPLAKRFSVLMYDQRGGGRSQLIKDANRLRHADHVRDLEVLREHFGLKQLLLVGESWGAALAALYAIEHPKKVRRLLLLGPMPPSRALIRQRLSKTDEQMRFSKRLAEYRSALPKAPDPISLCREFFGRYMAALFYDQSAINRRRGSSCDAEPEAVRNYLVVNEATLGSLGDYDLLPKLRLLGTPTLIVEGERSTPTLDGVRVWAETMPDARLLLVPNAGHYPQVERPDLFFPAVEEFLSGNWPAAAVNARKVS